MPGPRQGEAFIVETAGDAVVAGEGTDAVAGVLAAVAEEGQVHVAVDCGVAVQHRREPTREVQSQSVGTPDAQGIRQVQQAVVVEVVGERRAEAHGLDRDKERLGRDGLERGRTVARRAPGPVEVEARPDRELESARLLEG